MFTGKDILEVATRHLGEKYVYGCECPLGNPAWTGPWDCAEFVSWCAYQAYKIVFGAKPEGLHKANAYSGYWASDAREKNAVIALADACGIPGAILVRIPRSDAVHRDGHVAISLGTGEAVEARGTRFGVGIFPVAGRPWSMGVLLPGVTYEPPKAILGLTDAATPCFELDSPYQRGPAIRTIQAALAANGIHPGAMDGVFGPMLHAAVLAFQAARGLTPDGIVGSETAQALGISWPIPLLADDLWSAASPPTTPARPDEPGPEDVRPANADPAQDNAVTFTFEFASGRHYATASTGMRLCLGSPQHHVDDMPRLGLAQKPAHLAHLAIAGVYDPKDFDASHPGWSAFLHPTILAESGGYFGRINSYDRAGFTFGCPQFAAHTPGANLILLFRRLLTLPTARSYFPDLSLETDGQGEPRVHCLDQHGRMQNLETASQVLRPNGRTELQLLDFMRYLNANPVEVDQAELLALARLILWCVEDDEARRAQVDLAVTTSQKKLAAAAKKIPDLEGKPWQEACMVFDILHQGRGRYADIAAALEEHDPLEALSRVSIGPLPVQRIKTVRAVMDAITQQGVLNDWSPWDDIFG